MVSIFYRAITQSLTVSHSPNFFCIMSMDKAYFPVVLEVVGNMSLWCQQLMLGSSLLFVIYFKEQLRHLHIRNSKHYHSTYAVPFAYQVSMIDLSFRYKPLENLFIAHYHLSILRGQIQTFMFISFQCQPLIIFYGLSFSQFKPFIISFCLQVLYKHKIVLFGGFYDTLREVRSV